MTATASDAALAEYIARIEAEPARASITLTVGSDCPEAFRCDTTMRKHGMVIDEPKRLGGTDEGPSPVDLALAALASCQAITYRVWAHRMGIALERVHVEVSGDLDQRGFFGTEEGVRAGYGALRVRVTCEGPETLERYGELAEVVDQHCPLLDMYTTPVPVERVLVAPAAE
jgi:putative redox protein